MTKNRQDPDRCETPSKMFVKFLCLVVALLNGSENYTVQAKLRTVSEAFDDMVIFWFPDDAEFKESCVSEGCPGLNNFKLCPDHINVTVLHSVLNTAIGCMRKPICGIAIDNIPTIGVTFDTEEWLPQMEIDGFGKTSNGNGFLSNASNIKFDFLPDHNQTHQLPLQLTMHIPNSRFFGVIQMELSLRTMLPSIIDQALSVNLPNVKYDVGVEYVSTMSINHSLTASNFEINILNAIVKPDPSFCGLDTPDGFPSILTTFVSSTEIIIRRSSWAVRHSVLLEKYFQSVFRIVSNNC